jgi:hypothetical protein
MAAWTRDELDAIGAAEEVDIAPARRDGGLRKPVTVWIVRHGDDLYVRSVNGRESGWFRGVQVRREGRLRAGRLERDVAFADADPAVNGDVDAAYRAKYGHYTDIVGSILTPKARDTTLTLARR